MFETIHDFVNVNVSEELQIAAATLLPVLEITLGVMLLLKIRIKETLLAVTLLFLSFFLFSIYGFLIGLENDCGCFGSIASSSFGIGMVLRNFLFLLLSLTVLIKVKTKNPDVEKIYSK